VRGTSRRRGVSSALGASSALSALALSASCNAVYGDRVFSDAVMRPPVSEGVTAARYVPTPWGGCHVIGVLERPLGLGRLAEAARRSALALAPGRTHHRIGCAVREFSTARHGRKAVSLTDGTGGGGAGVPVLVSGGGLPRRGRLASAEV
jgi:hypothetical protein